MNVKRSENVERKMTEALSLSSLRLSVDEREKVAEIAGDLIAVQVYRELQRASERAADSGCNIIGNCSSSSKNELLQSVG